MPDPRDAELIVFLSSAGIDDSLVSLFCNATLSGCLAQCLADRPGFLRKISKLGVDKLSNRQKIANELTKAVRVGTLSKLSTADTLMALGDEDGDEDTVTMPADLQPQEPAPDGAPDALRIPRVIIQTNKTRRVVSHAAAQTLN